jgi:hypothetical protein
VLCWCLARLVIRVRSSPHAHRKEGRGRGWRCRSGWNRGRRDPAEGGIVSVCTPAATASSFGSGRLARCKWAQAAVHGIWPATTQPLCLGKSKLGESKVGCYRAGASSSYARERYPVALASRRQFLFFFFTFRRTGRHGDEKASTRSRRRMPLPAPFLCCNPCYNKDGAETNTTDKKNMCLKLLSIPFVL